MMEKRACKDGGTCHHNCPPDYCFRENYCLPLSGSGLNSDWTESENCQSLRKKLKETAVEWFASTDPTTLRGRAKFSLYGKEFSFILQSFEAFTELQQLLDLVAEHSRAETSKSFMRILKRNYDHAARFADLAKYDDDHS